MDRGELRGPCPWSPKLVYKLHPTQGGGCYGAARLHPSQGPHPVMQDPPPVRDMQEQVIFFFNNFTSRLSLTPCYPPAQQLLFLRFLGSQEGKGPIRNVTHRTLRGRDPQTQLC